MVNTAMLTEKLVMEVDANLTGLTSYGEYIPNWKTYKNIFASITSQKGSKKMDLEVGSQDYSDNISFYCYYHSDIQDKKAFRIRYNNLIYTIHNITTVQWMPRKAMVLDCIAILQ
jgi:SPP1 family predicted phage head-tail adaptor